ncbi:MAG: hypothetical protein HYT15_04850 [Candidatus Magasanikbacteria bacterium]|nr:hypothetical protein [Candidatus Magasanikbacteria bacterium]
MREQEPSLHNKDHLLSDRELSNLEIIDQIMTGNDDKRLQQLRDFLLKEGMSKEDIEGSIAARRLREQIHKEDRTQLEERLKTHPLPTSEELSMGAFAEVIERPIRNAVLTLRRKGYNTASSGFGNFNYQTLQLNSPQFKDLDTAVVKKLEALGVKVGDGSLNFKCNQSDPIKIMNIWDTIAAALPSLGEPSPDSPLPASQTFRNKFNL